jgi:hypothetical protein
MQAREYVPGQSLTALCYRVFSATPATSRGAEGPRANLFDWPLETTHRVLQGLALAHLLVFAFAIVRRRPRPPNEHGFALEAGLCVAMLLALAPVVHKAHMLWLLLPFALLLGIPSRLSTGFRRVRHALLGASILLIAGTSPTLLGDALATRLVSGNVVFLALECCLGALLLEILAPARISPSAG